jgi:glycosyltransferase involved in cell wall biosynthesis
MADLDVFVQVSSEPEPFGLVIVEAMSCGVPVVAGAAGGPLEILGPDATIRATGAGRLVPPADPVALADAVGELLPSIPSSASSRRARQPLREPSSATFAELFDAVAAGRLDQRPRTASR